MPQVGQLYGFHWRRSDDPAAPNPLPAPTNLIATAQSASSILLQWQDNSSDETQFFIYRAAVSGGPYTFIDTVDAGAISYLDQSLTPQTTYYYRVTAYRAAEGEETDELESSESNEAQATTLINAPGLPTNFTATAVSSSQINLAWTDTSSNETGFKIYRGLSAGSVNTLIHTTAANVQAYNDTGLQSSTTYFYKIESFNAAGSSGLTAAQSATTQAAGGSPTAVYEQNWSSIPSQVWTQAAFNNAYYTPSGVWNTNNSMYMAGGCKTVSGGNPYNNYQVQTSVARIAGGRAMRVQARVPESCPDDPAKTRQEIKFGIRFYEFTDDLNVGNGLGWTHGHETWVRICYYLPSATNIWWATAARRMHIWQVFGSERPIPANPNPSPVFAGLIGANGAITLTQSHGTGTSETGYTVNPNITLVRDAWNDIIFQWKKHYLAAQSIARIWHRVLPSSAYTLKYDYNFVANNRGSCPEKFTGSYFKAGLYRALEEPNHYDVYIDEIKLARGSNLLGSMQLP